MSLRFCDSFDHYLSGDIGAKWTNFSGVAIDTAGGRHGAAISGNGNLFKTLDMQGTWAVGFAAKNVGVTGGASAVYTMQALGTNGNVNTIVTIFKNVDGSLSVVSANNTVIGNSPAYDWTTSYHYVELLTTLSGTATITATCTLRVNTETVITGNATTGVSTPAIQGGAPKANVHLFSPRTNGDIDDLYINDGQGTNNNSFMGDVRIQCVYPNGDNTVNWTATTTGTTTTHFTCVNELTPDGDNSYVFSTATSSIELYDWQDISAFTGTVKGVQYLVYARKDAEGARVINMLEGTSGTNTLTNATTTKTDLYLNDEYDYHHVALDTSPSTGTNWTVAGFNGDRFGYRVGTNT